MRGRAILLALIFASTQTLAQNSTNRTAPDLESAQSWAQLAYERMSIRVPGQAPFHMKVVFHAFPGLEFQKTGQSAEILAGDGTYEETWIGPHQWRRTVELGPYKAVEVESPHGRKMQASSDFEPSRVLMLMMALWSPQAPNPISEEPRGLRIDYLTLGKLSVVRVSDNLTLSNGLSMQDSLFYSPKGVLLLSNQRGLITSWENDSVFEGKVVPRHIVIRAVDRDLLTADVTIEKADPINPADFDLPGGLAQPGMTLRPILKGFTPPGAVTGTPDWTDDPRAAIALFAVLDRTGKIRDIEVIMNVNGRNLEKALDGFRKARSTPARLDRDPCEIPIYPLATGALPKIVSPLQ